jgi:aspartate aminotransferase
LLTPSQRVRTSRGSPTVELNDRVRQMIAMGRPVIDLAAGDPDFATPAPISEAAASAMVGGDTHYGPSRGLPALRQAISVQLEKDTATSFDPASEIIVTASSKLALFITLVALVDPGDEVLIPTPSWVSYADMVSLIGGVPVAAPLDPGSDFRITASALAPFVSERSKAVVINSPNNPTGRVHDREEMATLVELAQAAGLAIVSDEIYNQLTYGSDFTSPAGLPAGAGRTIVVNGFSKTFAMTGWRLGYLAGPEAIISEILKVQQHTVSCASPFLQRGALVALESCRDQVAEMREQYRRRVDLVVRELGDLPGVHLRRSEGAFYVFVGVGEPGVVDDYALCRWLLDQTGVALAPGSAFGPGGEGHLRLSVTVNDQALQQACSALREALPAALSDPEGFARYVAAVSS